MAAYGAGGGAVQRIWCSAVRRSVSWVKQRGCLLVREWKPGKKPKVVTKLGSRAAQCVRDRGELDLHSHSLATWKVSQFTLTPADIVVIRSKVEHHQRSTHV